MLVSRLKKFVHDNRYFFYFLLIYFSVLIFINPTVNFPINDDWDNQLQVMAFRSGDYRIHSEIDASFILQPWIGYLWSFIFGYSFVSLRFLTIIFTIVLSYFIYLISKKHLTNKQTLLVLCIFILHPIILHSSVTFMTEIYFLTGIISSYYFFDKYLTTQKDKDIIISSIILGLTILFRQIAIVNLIAYLITLFFTRKAKVKNIIIIVGFVFVGVYIWRVYPRAGASEEFIHTLVERKYLKQRIELVLYSLPFFGISLSPYLFNLRKNKYAVLFLGLVSLAGGYFLFLKDVLPLGNIFYLECLLCKTKYRQIFNLFDNIIFKYFWSVVIVYSIVQLFINMFKSINVQLIKKDIHTLLLVLGYIGILLFPRDIYDRYALGALLFLSIYLIKHFKVKINKPLFFLFVFVSISLNFDFYRTSEEIFVQAEEIKNNLGHITSVYSYDIYIKYLESIKTKDYVGEHSESYNLTTPICYVQNYTEETDTKYFHFFDSIENFLNKIIDNPEMYGRRKKTGVRWIKNYKEQLIANEEYPSILYNMVGRKTYVGSFCVDSSE